MTSFIIILLVLLLCYSAIANRIPKTGREGISTGKEVTATIANINKGADRAVTLHAEGEGRRFKVKMKPTEAHLWVKGDKIRVIISNDNPKKYRVCFNDYFHDNEAHIRDHAVELMKTKIRDFTPAAKSINYTKETADKIAASNLGSQRIFAFVTMMKLIDSYIFLAIILGIGTFIAFTSRHLPLKSLLVPALAIALIIWYICAAVKMCAKIKSEAEK